jgi:predicted nucleic acid-binding protein
VTYLVDANVLSEATRPEPSVEVVDWLRANEPDLAVDPIILGEVRFGIYVLAAGKRRRRLERWFDQRVTTLVCLPWDAATGLRWADLLADLCRAGIAMSVKDSMITATALVHRLVVATRNVRHFQQAGVKVVDPFG